MTKRITLAMLGLLSTPVFAAETFVCVTVDSVGFISDGRGYEATGFKPSPFTLNLDADTATLVGPDALDGGEAYDCIHDEAATVFSCLLTTGDYMFNFNRDNGRFVRALGYGYVFDDEDTVSIDIGTCNSVGDAEEDTGTGA